MIATTTALYVLSIVHFAELHSPHADYVQPLHAFDTLAECWQAAETHMAEMPYDGDEAMAICTEGRP